MTLATSKQRRLSNQLKMGKNTFQNHSNRCRRRCRRRLRRRCRRLRNPSKNVTSPVKRKITPGYFEKKNRA